MKQIHAGRLAPVFHPDGTITLLDAHEKVTIGERISYTSPNYYGDGRHLSLGTGIVIAVSGDTITIDRIETREVPEPHVAPVPPSHRYQPPREEIKKLAENLWWCNGGGTVSQEETNDNWYEAEGLLRARHDG